MDLGPVRCGSLPGGENCYAKRDLLPLPHSFTRVNHLNFAGEQICYATSEFILHINASFPLPPSMEKSEKSKFFSAASSKRLLHGNM
ncbi:hypothetical protein Y1Q_0016283 [Alligator mississippiensis]|uniref:Uncharacterized protein n=1 Tax=Alligator mississippiensis TaxID=8496 RepID=A0A151M438_ALLMI|nr:hypothetical protein Y1Q_0016283 [Alligator mississippiensis]